MPTDHRATLAKIRRFDQLIAYLRDELDWPIARDSFEDVDDLFFDFTADELGIDKKTAANIQEIKRLRPLSANQPWGIFFIKFEPKRLPVVVLRRILSRVALKKRASANSAERAAWQTDDLLFVSNYGEGNARQISFAHFTENVEKKDLPTLKVLGWDNLDTALHLDHVADELRLKLAWPEDTADTESWRSRWRSAFTLEHRQVINTSKDLAVRLAKLARAIRNRIKTVLEIETEKGLVTELMNAFQEALIHDIDAEGFADMYAQTIAYGLLSARVEHPEGKRADDLTTQMPVTNPFLKELMEIFLVVGGRKSKKDRGPRIDFDELGVSEVVELLDDYDMEAVVRDFGDRNPLEDPVIHFYELFLKEYDAKKRMQRGVFYTPRPVVSFIVRSVDDLLRTEFGIEDGLADTTTWGEMAERFDNLEIPEGATPDQVFVQILDPATGTGTFLVEVIDLIFKTMTEKWQAEGHGSKKIEQLWDNYVPKYLLPRLHGYELMMAPYAIAHMKIGLKLYETGYSFGSDERARVYLTNALEPATDNQSVLSFLPALAHESQAVNEIKRNLRVTVVIGNPPYSGHSSNTGEWISQLIDNYYFVDGKPLKEKNSKWLQDDYVKFIRLGEYHIGKSGRGVHSYITNHGYIDNPTFRGLRQHLMKSYDVIEVLDLHGNSTKKERSPDGSEDENIFEIKQGVAIFAARCGAGALRTTTSVAHAHLFGRREVKYSELTGSTFSSRTFEAAQPVSPFYLFVPQNLRLRTEYEAYLPITHVMPVNVLGFQTHRDHFSIDIDETVLSERIAVFRDGDMTDVEAAEVFKLKDNRDWTVTMARQKLRDNEDWRKALIRCTYRPFDFRHCHFSTAVMDYPRREMLDHVANKENLCLGLGRQGIAVQDRVWSLVAISADPVDANIFRRGGINVFPLWLYPQEEGLTLHEHRRPNLSLNFGRALARSLGERKLSDDGLPTGIVPEHVVNYAFAIFHSLTFRTRYAEFLKIDFPHLPLPRSLSLFSDLARLGRQLISLHLMRTDKLDDFITTYIGPKNPDVQRIGWCDGTVWIDAGGISARDGYRATKSGTIGFENVPEEIWDMHIGGFQVCHKWLKDRKGRSLSDDDIAHYQKIIVALSETVRMMGEIDHVIEQHGGWPDAFASEASVPSVDSKPGQQDLLRAAEDSALYDDTSG